MTTTESKSTSTKTDWIIFLISLIAFFALLIYASEWFWVALPFMLTYLVKAMGRM